MKKSQILIIGLLVLVLLGTVAQAKSDKAIANNMIDLWDDSHSTFDQIANEEIGYKTVVSDFNNYAGRSEFIYEDAFKNSDNKEFVKLAAGTTIVMNLYAEGFREEDYEKVELATKVAEKVLIPQTKELEFY